MTLAQLILLLSAAVSTAVTTNSDQDAHLKWKTHYGNARKTAQAFKRPLVVVIENSELQENRIDEASLSGESLKKLANQDYELVRVDANTDYGKRVASAFGVQEFPYTAVTDDGSNRIVFRKSGPMSKADWTLALAKNSPPKLETSVEDSTPASAAERIIVKRPVVGQVSLPIYQQQPSYSEPVFQPTTPTQVFAPNGLYQLPASQCFT